MPEGVNVYHEGDIRKAGSELSGNNWPSSFEYTGYLLPVNFNKLGFQLPILTVNPRDYQEKHLSIAYFDPRRPDLAVAAGADMGAIMARLKPDLVLFPASSKSMALSHLAVGEAMLNLGRQDIQLGYFSGGDDAKLQEEINSIHQEGSLWVGKNMTGENVVGVSYLPVTQRQKHLWLTMTQVAFINNFDSGRIILGDDIVTTSATIGAMRNLLRETLIMRQHFPVVAAAFEGNEACSDQSIHYAIQLPEIFGKF